MHCPVDLDSPELHKLLDALSLEAKVRLLTGRDFWTTWPIDKIGLRRILVSDGPSGVRGEVWDERDPSLNLPSATALASSWDPEVARRYGNVLAVEARRKGVDVVLGPTINLHRSPLSGRHFEAFSEDPVLTADLAAGYVRGLQENGVGATPKHYIANDYETERFTASTEVSERALRELYLTAFEKAVTEARAWLVMSSYNAVNGVPATENELLRMPLKDEWGFDGVVISDWTAVRSLASAAAGQDLVMPGPNGPWGAALVDAVDDGRVPEAEIDRKVLRILLLAARVGALEGFGPARPEPVGPEDGTAFAREAAAEGTVLLANDGILPLDPARLRKVAVVGHNAWHARSQGGGSATVLPEKVVTPLDGIRAALPGTEVTYSIGAVVQHGIAELPLDRIVNPATGEHGMLVRFLDADGAELHRENRLSTALIYFGGDAPITSASAIELSLTWTPDTTGEVRLGFASVGRGRVHIDGELRREDTAEAVGQDLGASLLSPPSITTPLAVTAGTPVDVRVEFDMTSGERAMDGAFGITVGAEPVEADSGQLIAEAARAAADADVAVVVVGTNAQVESEGFDRTGLDLPGRQDDLVRGVAATGTPTVVVVNSGSPVLLPWRDEVSALLVPYFGGQAMGDALADVLLGVVEPGGRLPTTWPKHLDDVPVSDVTPIDGELRYDEGIHIGYRAWLRTGTEPAFPFGSGLGYTSWRLTDLQVQPRITAGEDGEVRLTVTNDGARAGKQVIQVYLSRATSSVDRPARWLAAHSVVRIGAGESVAVTIPLPGRAFADWRPHGWTYETGRFDVLVGTSVSDLPLTTSTTLED
ncbi:beta-glucosidase H [Streptomyces rugosispiralis]|uniref:Glycoside hydrolase family 3 C-terminal domain-containing protein n=1 Tax=Streptomyces rugosispiralis TaxID=2967341 RepID=A0ABT1UYR6_9ACTN|nr:glycoside hydrolase family 3 C-terminal domain-containing protein [Streptomyces rugosispiralis]MCQ8190262.1 glycoside hydrolase family 3 C-terminal domain-containing protein [Streptomyces rugosispiralis]